MNLRLNTLLNLLSVNYTQFLRLFCVVLLLFNANESKSQTEAEIKKNAEQLFEEEDYVAAYKYYAQLVSNNPRDPLFNYRLGVCMIYAEPDKKKSFSYLNQAYINRKDLPKDVTFFLGKAYHINYLFDEAIRYYNEFKQEAPSSLQKKLQVDREIRACGNGKRLLSALTDLEVISKKQLNEADYFRSYDLATVGGKLLVKPDEFKTGTDKKRKDKSVLYMPRTGEKVYFSSYGEGGKNGKDIFYKVKMADGSFSKPVPIDAINTEFDEDYPFIHPNGKTLYFASKGHNSMGGYDIFKTTYNEETESWTTPKNLEFPINSPDDDYLYVTDSLEKFAFFSTGRYTPPGKIDVLKIRTERRPIDFVIIKGTVAKEHYKQSVNSKIHIKNISTGEDVGTFLAEDNGNFLLRVPNGAKLLYTVETPDLPTQSQGISLPVATIGKPFKQTITYENKVLKIINNFEEAPGDDNYLQYLKLIEEKAKLNPNEGKNNLTNESIASSGNNNSDDNKNKQTNAVVTNNPSITNNPNSDKQNNNQTKQNQTKPTTGGMDNSQLLSMAKMDAQESAKEAAILNQDSKDAFELGQSKKIAAAEQLKDAQKKLQNAQLIDDKTEQKDAIDNANKLLQEAENDLQVADQILKYAKALENDAKRKKQEADLNKEYVETLEKIATAKGNTPESKNKINSIQQQLEQLANQKSESENFYTQVKNEVAEKENELSLAGANSNKIINEIRDIKNDINESENDLAKAKKKKEKEEIKNILNELNESLRQKEANLAASQKQEEKLTYEVNKLKNQIAAADKIKTEDIAKPIESPGSDKEQKDLIVSSKQLEEKYYGKTNVSDRNDPNSIASANGVIQQYNEDIDKQINLQKNLLAKETNPAAKKNITTEIKNLETLKKQNQQTLANNNVRINELNKQQAAAQLAGGPNTGLKPITEDNPNKTVDQIQQIKNSLTQADNQFFNFNSYSNPASQEKKIEADQQLNEAYALQNKLKETITKAEENIKTATVSTPKKSDDPDELLKKADELSAQAQNKRNEAKSKVGAEKTKLIDEAIELEKESEKKQIEASAASGKIANEKFEVNKQNILGMANSGKAPSNQSEKAKELLAEAETNLKQAKALREEAAAMSNNSAKIGNLGNAEEKEQIALNKQQEAVELLKKYDPDYTLATYKPNNSVNITNDQVLKEEVAKINQELTQLIKSKNAAYQSLSNANQDEITKLEEQFKNSNISDPKLKNQLAVAQKKQTEADVLKMKLNSASGEYDKLQIAADLVKKQTEAINEYNKLAESVAQKEAIAATNKNNNVSSPTNENNKQTNTGTESNNNSQNNNVASNNQTKVNNQNNNQTNSNAVNTQKNTNTPANPVGNEKANTVFAVDLSYENHKDTGINNINRYFKENDIILRNSQANSMKNNSLESLKTLESDYIKFNESVAANASNQNNNTSVSAAEMKNKIDSYNDAADNLNETATNMKNDAAEKTGAEREELLNQAKEIEKKAIAKKTEAAILAYQYNEASYNANKNAINDMLAALKNTKPDVYNRLKEEQDEIESGKKQTVALREEANAIKNNSAKLGAISNAEEEEADLLSRQNKLINELKNHVPNYVVKEPTFNNISGQAALSPEQSAQQKQLQNKLYNELTALTNAYNLEYETGKNAIPKNLNAEENKIKNNIVSLNSQAKSLLVKSTQTSNMSEKIRLVSLAAKTAHAAAVQLNVLINKEDVLASAQPKNNVSQVNIPSNTNNQNNLVSNTAKNNNTNNQNTTPKETNSEKNTLASNNSNNKNNNANSNNVKENNTKPPKNETVAANTKTKTAEPKTNEAPNSNSNAETTTGTKVIARVEGLEVLNKTAYSDAKPIPIDAKIPDGLVFRVQIGAFRNPVPNNSFRGLTPVNGESTGNGFIRYTAGNFNKIENATAVKNDLNRNGYPDAFVVAFFNGKRISINEALEILGNEGKSINTSAPASAGITENVSPVNIVPAKVEPETPVVVTKELEKTENLLYTVQIGVYSKAISREKLSNLSPIYTERLANGLYRYTAGIYNNTERLVTDKNKVVSLGIRDAFVTAYLNGKRISYNEAKDRQNSDLNIKLEPENPIVFPAVVAATLAPAQVAPVAIPAPTVAPFKNNITSYPQATEENGIKTDEEGICFKVQIGAYSKQVPNEVAAQYNAIKNWPIENKVLNGLYLYTIGNFKEAKFAKQLKDEAVSLGITDAFITVYKDGRKLFGEEAAQYLSR